ncbi:MAG TPA: SUMF1/EgtB/PvdO family nonheme iron enzyme [Acetobacteraceae bacterium]|nr:SUMF1/EgtB/PvdO family nonheme iron enzyme [Acetobacteraceae bacterium]
MLGFIIAALACTGSNCDITNLEPGASYPTYAACQAQLTAKAPSFKTQLDERRTNGRTVEAICMRETSTITEVEEPYDVLDTAIVHSEASAGSPFVGIVESGQRALVTGIVTGTQWVRVLLPDGKSGFVFSDHLRRVGGAKPSAEAAAPPAPPAAPPAPPPPVAAQPTPRTNPLPTQNQAVAPPPAPRRADEATTAVKPPTPTPPTQTPPAVATGTAPPPRPAESNGREFRDCENCPIMVAIPAGEFTMGSNADPSERPIHRVHVRPFAIGKFELSVAEWQACVDAGACTYKPASHDANPGRRPMANLSWEDAAQYLRWLEKITGKPYRLLTEAEWEYAARAGTATRYAWGEEVRPGRADCEGCGPTHDRARPADLGSFPPNAWGLYDMEGNIAEWVDDCWHSSYQGAPAGGEAWRSASCGTHVLRGGSWNNPPSDITVSSRNFYDGNVRYPGNGMRVGMTMR